MKKLLSFGLIIVIVMGTLNFLISKLLFNENLSIINKESYLKEDAYLLDDIETFNQYPNYPTGCESVAVYLLLRHYDVDITVDDIISSLNKGPVPYGTGEILNGANPEREFVGSPYNNQSYGVFEEPIRDVANIYRTGAMSRKNASIDEIEGIIKSGHPLVAWIRTKENYDPKEYGKPWLDYQTGEMISWIRYEHAVLVYGYSDTNIYISNPYNGKKYKMDKELFKYNFDLMGGRIVYYSK